ncbi:MAG: hypothetical protein ACK4GC_09450, partial [Paracoccaceae bacterium]
GDDVLHASFGDGVVIAVERGGVVVVRFATDGAERCLDVGQPANSNDNAAIWRSNCSHVNRHFG